ncbi:hypothetical protein [uncultured Sphingomonas sp.]|uniref:hypothetical protein n=1 Tax=uncultured Sphingomonas sp. TaxID=158754 RepID=UPI0030FC139E
MTDATPLASEQITQEDREAAASNIKRRLVWQHGGEQQWMDASTASMWMGEQDDHDEVQAFARHRIAALSATPAPSDQDASQAQGEVERVAQALFGKDAAKALAALSPAPGATAQDGVELPAIPKGEARAFVQCKTHGRVGYYDYVPYSFSTAVSVMPCGCDAKHAKSITEEEFRVAFTPTPTIPAGMVAVPREPTDAILEALRSVRDTGRSLHNVYTTILAAAPKQAEQQGVEALVQRLRGHASDLRKEEWDEDDAAAADCDQAAAILAALNAPTGAVETECGA